MLLQLRNRIFLCVLGALLGICPHFQAAEPAKTLEDYLKQLGYQAVEFQETEYVQDFVDARLANGHKARLLVDTGWGITALKKSVARGLKELSPAEVQQYDPSFRSGTNAEFVLLDKLTLGQAQLLNQPARVEELRADYIRVPFEGALGCDFLSRNFCLIDCFKHRLYVRVTRPSTDESQALEGTLRASGYAEAPLELAFRLTTTVQINGKAVRMEVDTGAPYDELDDSQARALGLEMLKYDRPSTGSLIPGEITANVIGMGQVGKHRVHFARLATFQLGPRQWKNFNIGISDLKDWGLAKPGTSGEAVKGRLSQPTLARQGTLIDVAGGKLWFRPEKPTRN